jgi:hypothetical protein
MAHGSLMGASAVCRWSELWRPTPQYRSRCRLSRLTNRVGLSSPVCKLQAAPQHGFAGNAVVEQIVQLIEQRWALTLRRWPERARDFTPDTESGDIN